MFLVLLLALLVAATVHAMISRRRSRQELAELFLLYVLVGYCGFAMFLVSGFSLLAGDRVAAWLGWPLNNPFQQFLSFALLGLATAAILSIRYRDTYLVGPVVAWSVFFIGATYGHLGDLSQRGVSHGTALHVFTTHTSIPILLLGLLALSGAVSFRRRDENGAGS